MRKPLLFALLAVIVLLGAATTVLFTRYQKSTADYVTLQAAEEAAQNRYAMTINAIAEIQDSLNAIAIGDASVQMQSGDAERQISAPSGQEALDRIAQVRESIARSKTRIRQLESSLKKSGIRVAGLQKMVANLKQSVEEKEQLVAELSTQVGTLQTQVAGLETTVEENQTAIEEKRRELATVYVAVGSKQSLTESGVVEAKGGLLGMGKTLQPTGKFDQMAFRPVDTDQETVIPIPSTKALVVSAQPPSSYEVLEVDGQLQLHILDPVEFRKVRQLVIVTA